MAKKNTDRLDLNEALLKRPYDHGVICTFKFDPYFFEKDCLDTFRSLNYNGNLTVLIDRGTYDEIIERAGSDRPSQANLRYLLHPVSVRGLFHPKIFLFASRSRGRLIFGSANFTRAGLHGNAELAGCYDYEADEDEAVAPLFQSVFAFLMRIGQRWSGEALTSNLNYMAAEAPWLVAEGKDSAQQHFELLHNLDSPLWEQIISRVTSPVQTLSIVSRYFDQSPAILNSLYEGLKPKKIRIYTQNNTTTLTKDYLSHPLVKKGAVEILLCDYSDEGQYQKLHAKGLAVETNQETLFAYGSANCSTPALLKSSDLGNVEVMLLLRGLTKRTIRPERLFDPSQTAVHLKDEMILQPEEREKVPAQVRRQINLLEASLDEKLIRLRALLPDIIRFDHLSAALTFLDDTKSVIPLRHLSEQVYVGEVSEQLLQKLSESSSVVHIYANENRKRVATSNGMFVTYLQDIGTGRSLRRERSLKEARQSPAQFFEVFASIVAEGDDEATKNFLDSFNVRVTDLPLPEIYRAVKPVWEVDRAFMMIRGRPWIISDTVHEAVIKFFDRHYKRLQRHVENRSPEGLPNFMHIVLTTGAVLHGQIAHGVAGLKARASLPFRPEQWSRQRDRLAAYFSRYKDLLDCLTKQYLSPMSRRYQAAEIKEHVIRDPEMLQSLTSSVINLRKELETLRVEKLRVERVLGDPGVAPLFPASLFHESQWPTYERELNSSQGLVEALLG